MPGFVLDVTSTVLCLHAGQARATTVNPRVTVSHQPTVTISAPYVVAGCGLTGTGAPPCTTAQWIVAATRVRSGGQPLLLQDSQAICPTSGTGLIVMTVQPRVRAQ